MKPPDFPKEATVFLYRGDASLRAEPIGSGFMVAVSEQNQTFGYIVTCAHVVSDGLAKGGSLQLRLNKADGSGIGRVQLPSAGWLKHPDENVDLAVLPQQGFAHEPLRVVASEFKTIAVTQQIPSYKPQEGNEVVFVGLFPKVPGESQNVPVFRFGRIALTTDEPIRGPNFGPTQGVVVESHFNRGNSGAPLYQTIQTSNGLVLYLIGTVAAGYPNAGLVIAVPEQRLAEILYGDEATKQRKDHLSRGQADR